VSARTKARKRALDLLFESDLRNSKASDLLFSRPASELSQEDYVVMIINGIELNLRKIDELITTYAQGWDIDRMPTVDRNIMRIALYEILWGADIDDQIAASQAIILAQEYSTEESAKYINGVLGRIIALKPSFAL
jgi:N utilization substance protein B